MLNRVAVSGGSYEDWIDVTWTSLAKRRTESPIYQGGLSTELIFQEIVSNAKSENQPLGTLAGRGQVTGKKGGKVKIKIGEPSMIYGIVSLTPRLDYSQGNAWYNDIKTMDDFHKPALDQIGFQELITDRMAWWDTQITMGGPPSVGGFVNYKSAGKQPAWIDYMTNTNKVYGNFAEENQQMFMVLNRRYDEKFLGNGIYEIKDLTTYIDPSKYNHVFADTRLDAQNFWVQIGIKCIARRKMSAKVIPNL